MKVDKDLYTSHINDNSKRLEMRKIIDKIESVLNNHEIEITDFLDPYEIYLAKSILNRFTQLEYIEFGGIPSSERMIIVIFPYYYDIRTIDLNLSYLRISGDISDLTHKDFLGGLLSLGIKRTKLGDILVHNSYVDIIVKMEISDFILMNLERIGNSKVTIIRVEQDKLKAATIKYNDINCFVTSLRLDVFLSSIYNLSRTDSINIIKAGNVKVNWEIIDKPSKELKKGDNISTKGYGRSLLYSIDGKSKKGRLHLTVRILI